MLIDTAGSLLCPYGIAGSHYTGQMTTLLNVSAFAHNAFSTGLRHYARVSYNLQDAALSE